MEIFNAWLVRQGALEILGHQARRGPEDQPGHPCQQ